ncbi:DUF169 domain-containing protein [Clostridium botulinum]|uniref:DUF169 domain-containing protein n=1 Tax=Clostridium botulinum TaxID=1491 RepID=UPI001C9A636B|nr:DUF169 domain-containing protein [Clostridium botulinum]MBY6797130.1 DUF169 domain-containing protein [Clostridium botulinum]MBY6866448.1 DUF169 domain-containing protein [Clostridium botulinum]
MDIKNICQNLYATLNLERKMVGIKFIFTKEHFEKLDIPKLNSKVNYCYMVKMASNGREFKANEENFNCLASARALGIISSNNYVDSGQHYGKHGLYDSLATAKKVQKDITFINHSIYGIEIRPLENFIKEPDVVIIITNPYNVMRIVQAYTYKYGVHKNITLGGNQGICSECTAVPYENNDLNISTLCSGTRFFCKWDECDMGVGFPFNKLKDIENGILKTLNPTEQNYKKKKIELKCKNIENNIDIKYNENYFVNYK